MWPGSPPSHCAVDRNLSAPGVESRRASGVSDMGGNFKDSRSGRADPEVAGQV